VKLGAAVTVKLCCTWGAAEYDELPAWFASMMQVPTVRKVAVAFETVQMLVVVEVNVTARPELAVAESVRGVPTVCVPGLLNVMVCADSVAWPMPVTVTVPVLVA